MYGKEEYNVLIQIFTYLYYFNNTNNNNNILNEIEWTKNVWFDLSPESPFPLLMLSTWRRFTRSEITPRPQHECPTGKISCFPEVKDIWTRIYIVHQSSNLQIKVFTQGSLPLRLGHPEVDWGQDYATERLHVYLQHLPNRLVGVLSINFWVELLRVNYVQTSFMILLNSSEIEGLSDVKNLTQVTIWRDYCK